MTYKPALFPSNEKRRAETVAKIDLIDKHHDDLFYSYCELGKVLSGFEGAAVTVMTSDRQCSLSTSDGKRVEGEREASLCQYAILEKEPTIVYELRDHPIFKEQRMVVSGELVGSFCAFPIINKNNYALGTFCLVNEKPTELSPAAIENLKALVDRLAFQLDTYIDQSELTAEKVFNCVTTFNNLEGNLKLDDLQSFLALICDRPLRDKQKKALIKANLLNPDASSQPYQLSQEGINLKQKMGLSTTPMKRQKVVGTEANNLIEEMFENLSDL